MLDTDASNDSTTLQQTFSLGESYNVTLTNLGSATAWELTSVGTAVPNASQTIQMVVEITPARIFQQAIFGEQDVRSLDTGFVDSYRST